MRRARDSKRKARSSGGAVVVEFLLCYIPTLVCFLSFWQLSELLIAKMVVERASSAAGRAAVVVLPDDPAFYNGEPKDSFVGQRQDAIRYAAGMILAASPHLGSNFSVSLSPVPTNGFGLLDVDVAAPFHCDLITLVCGGSGVINLDAKSTHAYHGAAYLYEVASGGIVNGVNGAADGCRPSNGAGGGSRNGGGGGARGGGSGGGKGGGGPGKDGGTGTGTPGKDGGTGTPGKDGGTGAPDGGTGAAEGGTRAGPMCPDGTKENPKVPGACVCNDPTAKDLKSCPCPPQGGQPPRTRDPVGLECVDNPACAKCKGDPKTRDAQLKSEQQKILTDLRKIRSSSSEQELASDCSPASKNVDALETKLDQNVEEAQACSECLTGTKPPDPCAKKPVTDWKKLVAEIQKNPTGYCAPAGKTAVFWSGGNPPAPMNAAQKWAGQNGGTTLEQTPSGKALDAKDLFERNSKAPADRCGLTRKQAGAVWNAASEAFANCAKGPVVKIQDCSVPPKCSTWSMFEKRILLNNTPPNPIKTFDVSGMPDPGGLCD